jgi:hypothetical protein
VKRETGLSLRLYFQVLIKRPATDAELARKLSLPRYLRGGAAQPLGHPETFRNRCDVLEITAATGHEVATATVSC